MLVALLFLRESVGTLKASLTGSHVVFSRQWLVCSAFSKMSSAGEVQHTTQASYPS